MPRRVLVQAQSDQFDLVEVPASNEHELQEVVNANPRLIPSDDLGLDDMLLVVGRETTLASGSIDLLCLARTGDLVLIEFKTGPQNPDFRSALAQVIDYGSDLWQRDREEFDHGVVQRYLRGPHCMPAFKSVADLGAAIALTGWQLTSDDLDSLFARLTDVLATGDFIYVIVAQRFTEAMHSSVDYLNTTMRYGRFYLVEVVKLAGPDLAAYAAQVVARPSRRTAPDSSTAQSTNESEFLSRIDDDEFRQAMKDVFATCHTLGMTVSWGSGGSSIRISTPDRTEPLSVGWTFLDGAQWYGAKHLTLGVDPSSLAHTPSVAPFVIAYVEAVSNISGGVKTPGKLDAYTFAPAVVPQATESIIAALEGLISAIQHTGGE